MFTNPTYVTADAVISSLVLLQKEHAALQTAYEELHDDMETVAQRIFTEAVVFAPEIVSILGKYSRRGIWICEKEKPQ